MEIWDFGKYIIKQSQYIHETSIWGMWLHISFICYSQCHAFPEIWWIFTCKRLALLYNIMTSDVGKGLAMAITGKCKVVPLQARCGPEFSRRFRLPDFHELRHMKVVRSSASRTSRLYPQECSWYSFLLGTESTPGPWCGRKYITENSSDKTGNQSRDRPTSSAEP